MRVITKEIDIAIGANIRAARIARGMTQRDLADTIGTSFQQIQKYESGKDRVAASTLIRIADELGMCLNCLSTRVA